MTGQAAQPQTEAALFPKLTPDQLAALEGFGEEIALAPDQRLFAEGDPEQDFFIVLEGRLKVTRDVDGDAVVLVIHEPGEFTGALSLLSGEPSIANADAVGPTRVRRICTDDFRRMLVEQPEIAGMILATMAKRRPEADTLVLEREKLAALGKMAAGLAHELNNPATAARRAAGELRGALATLQTRTCALGAATPREVQRELERRIGEMAAPPARSPLEQSDLEEAVGAWLDDRGVTDAWKLAPALVDGGLDPDRLEEVGTLSGEAALAPAVAWVAAHCEVDALLRTVEQSTSRIADLVAAIKSYSYMDQAPNQAVDVVEGLENTLTILEHKWRKRRIEIVRQVAPGVPRIPAYGSELNQVWTNLLDNAIDAAPAEGGRITVEVTPEDGRSLLVAITDNGPGIPEAHFGRIFEPFFTTKEPGKGTGLGLDIAYRIVTQRHGGDIRVLSRPGETRFEVRLPMLTRPR